MNSPQETHMKAVHSILRYLKSSPGKVLFAWHNHLKIKAYTDADWAGSIIDWRSTSGYCLFVGGNLVTWSKKQSVVARSNAEVEFRAMTHGICEIMVEDINGGVWYDSKDPIKLFCDNKAATNIAHNPVLHNWTKHIEIDRHLIKEKLHKGIICTPYVRTRDQLANILTKGVATNHFYRILDKLGMRDIYASAWGGVLTDSMYGMCGKLYMV